MSDRTVGSARRASAFVRGSLRAFDLSIGEMLWSRRTIFMTLLATGPVALGAFFRVLDLLGRPGMRVNGVAVAGSAVFGGMVWLVYLRFLVPVLGAFYGTALIADEVEDRTITYLFTRPIPRGAVAMGKYLAYLVCTALVVLPSVVGTYFLVAPIGGGAIGRSFPLLLVDLGLLALGLSAYGALFAFIGARIKRPLVVGLVFAFGWEQLALLVPGYLRRFTLAYYLQALVPHAMPQDDTMAAIQALFAETPSPATSVGWLLAILVVCLVLTVRTVDRREYVLEQ